MDQGVRNLHDGIGNHPRVGRLTGACCADGRWAEHHSSRNHQNEDRRVRAPQADRLAIDGLAAPGCFMSQVEHVDLPS